MQTVYHTVGIHYEQKFVKQFLLSKEIIQNPLQGT